MKRKLKRILLTAILILYIGDFYGQEKEEGQVYDGWTYMGVTEDGYEAFTKKHKPNKVWIKIVFEEPQEQQILFKTIIYSSVVSLFKIDCRNSEYGMLQGALYSKDGDMVHDEKTPYPKMETPYPDSFNESVLEFHCTKE